MSSLSSKSFRFVANVDGAEAQMTEAGTIVEAEAAAVFDELEVAIWGCCSQLLLWFPTEQWRLDEVEVATAKIGESCKNRENQKLNFIRNHLVTLYFWNIYGDFQIQFCPKSFLAFSTNLCPIKSDLSGNTCWPQASDFQKLAKMDIFWCF